MRALVLTVVHHPADARIQERQIRALLDAGHSVTYAAPFSSTGCPRPNGCTTIELPRAVGRRRLAPLRRAREVLRAAAPEHDIVILHDPELLLVAGAAKPTPVVWDVHEDLGAALVDKTWLPAVARSSIRAAVRWVERRAERRWHLILAEAGYQARFSRDHPVIANEPSVPDRVRATGPGRAVYVGRLSSSRGVESLVAVGDMLPSDIDLDLYGWAEPECTPTLEQAAGRGALHWHGRTPNAVALDAIVGATAGLSLLRDLPNYRHSRPTKVVEYMSRGIPVVTTPTPVAREIVERHGCGIVVPFDDPSAVRDAIELLHRDDDLRHRLGTRGHEAALAHYDWRSTGPRFVRTLERWSR